LVFWLRLLRLTLQVLIYRWMAEELLVCKRI
jgi:hypothetical protein